MGYNPPIVHRPSVSSAASASALPRSKEEKGQQALLPPAANEQAPAGTRLMGLVTA